VARKGQQQLTVSMSLADRLHTWGAIPYEECKVKFWLPTKQTPLDCAISGGKGIPGGRSVMIRGPENSGKDVFAFLCIASAQEHSGRGILLQGERRIGDGLINLTGVCTDTDSLLIRQPKSLQELLDDLKWVILQIVMTPYDPMETPTVIVVNSVASFGIEDLVLVEKNKKGVREKNQPMSAPALWDRFFKSEEYKLIADRNIYIIFINQLRDNVDFFSYGPKTSNSPGGWAIKHNISVRIDIERMSLGPMLNDPMKKQLDDEFEAGYVMHQKITKNDVGPGGRQARSAWFGHYGLDDVLSMFSWLCDCGYIYGNGSGRFTIGDQTQTYVEWLEIIRGNHQWEFWLREMFKKAYVDRSLYKGKPLLHGSED